MLIGFLASACCTSQSLVVASKSSFHPQILPPGRCRYFIFQKGLSILDLNIPAYSFEKPYRSLKQVLMIQDVLEKAASMLHEVATLEIDFWDMTLDV